METQLPTIGIHRDGDVLTAVIDNPRSGLNTVDGQLHEDLTALFRMLKREDQARVAILTGSNGAFSAGGDFKWFPTLRDTAKLDHLRRDAKQLIWDLVDIEIPIIAAINGPAVGLGASIALLCDVIFMADDAIISDPHVRVGLVAGDGGTAIWPLLVGPARAKEYLMTGDPLTAGEAERIGLINRVFPSDRLLSETTAFANRIASGAPLAIRFTKMAVNKLIKDALNVAFDSAGGWELVTFLSDDHQEALQAISERRHPHFRGR
jgi:enoyl-CoA hydratase